jgi:hypothetical protein
LSCVFLTKRSITRAAAQGGCDRWVDNTLANKQQGAVNAFEGKSQQQFPSWEQHGKKERLLFILPKELS